MPPLPIVGAGITGLTVAYELHKRGVSSTVYEAGARSGGLIRTERAEGFTVEAGPDSVLATKPAALDLANELGLGDQIQEVRTPGAYVLRGHRLFRLPSPSLLGLPLTWRAVFGYDLLPWRARLRLARGLMARGDRSGGAATDADVSVAGFFRSRFGPDAVDLIAQPLLGGIHAGDIEQLSMASLFPRLLELDRAPGGIFGARAAQTQTSGRPGSPFRSLRGGMSVLVDALESQLPAGTIRYGTPLASIPDGRPVIIAAPAYVAAAMLEPIDPEAAAICAAVPYVSTVSVALAWPRSAVPHPLDGTGFVVARRHSDVRITACTWVSQKWDGRAPADMTLLRAFVGGAHDPAAIDVDDDDLVAIVRRDLGAVLGVTAGPALARVYRWRRMGAQHTVGHLARMAELERRLAPRGIFVAGSGFKAVGIPDCVADARRTAGAAAEFAKRF